MARLKVGGVLFFWGASFALLHTTLATADNASSSRSDEPSVTTSPHVVTVVYHVYVPAPEVPPSDGSRKDPKTFHRHDGFFLRMGVDTGYLWNFAESRRAFDDFSVRGAPVLPSFALGGTLTSGLVVGGTVGFAQVFSPVVEQNGSSVVSGQSARWLELGPFVDYYPNPSNGWHVLGGVSYLNFEKQGRTGSVAGFWGAGVSMSLGIGYEEWISNQWSFGGRLKLTAASLSQNGDANEQYDYLLLFPSVGLTFTYH